MDEKEPKGLPRPLYIAGFVFQGIIFLLLLSKVETWAEVIRYVAMTTIFLIFIAYWRGWLKLGNDEEEQ